jgi:hypothetical protein
MADAFLKHRWSLGVKGIKCPSPSFFTLPSYHRVGLIAVRFCLGIDV